MSWSVGAGRACKQSTAQSTRAARQTAVDGGMAQMCDVRRLEMETEMAYRM